MTELAIPSATRPFAEIPVLPRCTRKQPQVAPAACFSPIPHRTCQATGMTRTPVVSTTSTPVLRATGLQYSDRYNSHLQEKVYQGPGFRISRMSRLYLWLLLICRRAERGEDQKQVSLRDPARCFRSQPAHFYVSYSSPHLSFGLPSPRRL